MSDVQPGLAADGNGLVLFVPWTPGIADTTAPELDELSGGTVKDFTYGLTPDGFRDSPTENTITSGRYTLENALTLPGTITDALEIQYVYTNVTADDVIRTALPKNTKGFIVHRLGYANELALDEDQLVDIFPVQAGVQRRVAPTANSELQIVQTLHVIGKVQRFVAIVDSP